MNGSSTLVNVLVERLPQPLEPDGAELAMFPPAVYLSQVLAAVGQTGVSVGIQNLHSEPSGAFTGEIAGEMARELGARYALVGHSERREYFGEDDELVARKFAAAQRAGLVPVLCLGEGLAQRESGQAERTVLDQLDVVLGAHGVAAMGNAVVAYEPVWAIGTGQTATPADAQAMHAAIRSRLGSMDAGIAKNIRILYGGSVNADNAGALLGQPDVDGGLVGGASLDPEQFAKIYEAARLKREQ